MDDFSFFFRKKEEVNVNVVVSEEPVQGKEENETENVNVSRTLTYEVDEEEQKQKSEEVKLVWKNSAGQAGAAKSPAAKAFFNPTSKENQTSDAEQVSVATPSRV